ncbi:MAG: hypothetical protein JWR80_10012 [Bradyrhizobium sp.]|nr:hypothetical protein [Bradyrhizobium sp.]
MRRPIIKSRQQQVRAAIGERMSDAAYEVLAERERQFSREGWTPGHDDSHDQCEMAHAAASYALGNTLYWPWDMKWWKPADPRRNLIRAGALIIAEIERIDRRVARIPQDSTRERQDD